MENNRKNSKTTFFNSKSSKVVSVQCSPVKHNLSFTPKEISSSNSLSYSENDYIQLKNTNLEDEEEEKNESILTLSTKDTSLNFKIDNDLLLEDNINHFAKSKIDLPCVNGNFSRKNNSERYNTVKNKNNIKSLEKSFDEIIINLRNDMIKKNRKISSLNENTLSTHKEIFNKYLNEDNSLHPKQRISFKEKICNNNRCIYINSDELKSLSNMEEITNFYSYTEDCFRLMFEIEKIEKINKCKPVEFDFIEIIKKGEKKLAIFDLDETLVHCQAKNIEECQHIIEVKISEYKKAKIGVNIRPNWEKALNIISKDYIIVVFTASHSLYANAVLNFMDKDDKYFKYRLFRNNCTSVYINGSYTYIKDLSVFKDIDLKDMIIIDNSVVSFTFNLDNGLPILPYYNSNKDNELLCCAYYLISIFDYNDLRDANKKFVKLQDIKKKAIENSYIEEESSIEEDSSEIDENNSEDNNYNLKNKENDNKEGKINEGLYRINTLYKLNRNEREFSKLGIVNKNKKARFSIDLRDTLKDLNKLFNKENSIKFLKKQNKKNNNNDYNEDKINGIN
jgi:Dullard-like phosphatase family protein